MTRSYVAAIGDALQKLEGFKIWVITSKFNLAFNLSGIVTGFFIMEEVAMLEGDVLDALKTPEEVKVPVAAAELTIGHSLEPRGLFLVNQVNY